MEKYEWPDWPGDRILKWIVTFGEHIEGEGVVDHGDHSLRVLARALGRSGEPILDDLPQDTEVWWDVEDRLGGIRVKVAP